MFIFLFEEVSQFLDTLEEELKCEKFSKMP